MPPNPEWHASVAEPVIDPERPIVDPHHHLWERSGMDYLLEDLWADTGSVGSQHREDSVCGMSGFCAQCRCT